ncbi:MAG TPA: 1-deoxy-D-xylulose-5-phosphate reductoisomerase [Planctomycetota bacterium]|nr:1-deoxy-D-xylulose-5-phosphate reductoisomerase [Planctomycetota bacterium]
MSEATLPRRLTILGSTGSIGRSVLDVVRSLPDRFDVRALAARANWRELAGQVREFSPKVVALFDTTAAEELRTHLAGEPVEVLAGEEGVVRVAEHGESDMVVSAIVGSAGLAPTLAAVRAQKSIALANKETIVMAGELVMREAAKRGVEILPVDSEHSAIWQAMSAGKPEEIARVIITGSGGPFRGLSSEELAHVTPEQALNHPTWQMGPKVTIDSATLMNKALEVIEARLLFGLDVEQIEVLIHPESIVHSLVEFVDGSVVAQMSTPDMRGPIQYALTWPDRFECPAPRLRLSEVGELHFERPDVGRFPAVELGFEAARRGGTAPAALSAANEVAVGTFLDGKLRFTDIASVAAEVMKGHRFVERPTLDDVLEADRNARAAAAKLTAQRGI